MISPGQVLHLRIEKPAAGGRMIARIDGQIALVAGAIPGEQVQARVERVTRGVLFMETVGVDEPSADRRDPAGDPLCGGCLFNHIAYPRQLDIKAQVIVDAFSRIAHLSVPNAVRVEGSPEEGYRMRARLHVRESRIGFFREGTHELCDPRQTRQLLPVTCEVLDRLADAMRSLSIRSVREIEMAENTDASDRAVAFGTSAALDPRVLERLGAIDGITGVDSPSGSFGTPYVVDRLRIEDGAPILLKRHVGSFFQGNRHLLQRFVEHVTRQIPPDSELLDLYAGVGLFSVCAASARRARATAVEGDRVAAADLAANASTSGGAVTAVSRPVEEFVGGGNARAMQSPSTSPFVIIVDPPRTGMSPAALDGMVRLGAERIVYVSCDVATLARDGRKIVEAGYGLTRADAFDLFPNTPHVETIVVFDRVRQPG